MQRIFIFLLLITLCEGCVSHPVAADAQSAQGIYRSKDYRFTISLPASVRNRARGVQITEQFRNFSGTVSFDPELNDESVFRLEILHKTTLQSRMFKLKNIAQSIVDGLLAQMVKSHQTRPVLDFAETISVSGHEALHWRYYQTIIADTPAARFPRIFQHEI